METKHLEMMKHPERWSSMNGFVLPLKHRTRTDEDGTRLLGFMFEDPKTHQALPRVYIGIIFFLTTRKLDQFKREDYTSLDEVVRNGWEVD